MSCSWKYVEVSDVIFWFCFFFLIGKSLWMDSINLAWPNYPIDSAAILVFKWTFTGQDQTRHKLHQGEREGGRINNNGKMMMMRHVCKIQTENASKCMTHPCRNWDFSKLLLLPLWMMAGAHLSPQTEDPFPKKTGDTAFSHTMSSCSKVLSPHTGAQCHSIQTHVLILGRSKNGNVLFASIWLRYDPGARRRAGAPAWSCAHGDACEIVCVCVCARVRVCVWVRKEWSDWASLIHTANHNAVIL